MFWNVFGLSCAIEKEKDCKYNLGKNDCVNAYTRVDPVKLQKLANMTSLSVVKDFFVPGHIQMIFTVMLFSFKMRCAKSVANRISYEKHRGNMG